MVRISGGVADSYTTLRISLIVHRGDASVWNGLCGSPLLCPCIFARLAGANDCDFPTVFIGSAQAQQPQRMIWMSFKLLRSPPGDSDQCNQW